MIAIVVGIVNVRQVVGIRNFFRVVESISVIIEIISIVDSIAIKIFTISVPNVRDTIVIIVFVNIVGNPVSVVVIVSVLILVVKHVLLHAIRNSRHDVDAPSTGGRFIGFNVEDIILYVHIHGKTLHKEQSNNKQNSLGSHDSIHGMITLNLIPYHKTGSFSIFECK